MPRELHKNTIFLIDTLLASNALAKDSIAKKRPRQLFIETAKAFLGIKEVSVNKGTEVELYQKTVNLSPGDMWCMSFIQTC